MYDKRRDPKNPPARKSKGAPAPSAQSLEGPTVSPAAGAGGTCTGCSSLDYSALDGALRDYPGSFVRIMPDRGDVSWYKLALRSEPWPRHYIVVSCDAALPLAAGLAALSRKVEAWQAGHFRPSPD